SGGAGAPSDRLWAAAGGGGSRHPSRRRRTEAGPGPAPPPHRTAVSGHAPSRRPRLAFTRRGPHRAVEGPLADVIDLFLHGLRERHDVGGRVEEVLVLQCALLETRGRQCRDHALLDLGAGPTLREVREGLEIESLAIDSAPP